MVCEMRKKHVEALTIRDHCLTYVCVTDAHYRGVVSNKLMQEITLATGR